MVYCTCFESSRGRNTPVGSNPTLSESDGAGRGNSSMKLINDSHQTNKPVRVRQPRQPLWRWCIEFDTADSRCLAQDSVRFR